MLNKPNLFSYPDYRLFLRDLFAQKKQDQFGFSFRSISRLAGFKSSNFLKLVIDGKRNLSTEGILKLARALKLNLDEMRFFETLVLFNQAKTHDEKSIYFERMSQFKSYTNVKQIEADQYLYFSNWHFVAIRESVVLKGFKEDHRWINKKLKTNLTREEIKKIIDVLLSLNLLCRDSQGLLKQTDQMLVVKPEIADLSIMRFQKALMEKGIEALEALPASQREMGTVTVTVSKATFEKMRERIIQLRRELNALSVADKDPEAVAQLNIQLFTLSEVSWK